MKISIVYPTYRLGGFDLLVDCLKRQTHRNFELIVVDDYPGRDLRKYIADQGISLSYYGPSKEKQYKDTPYSFANAFNTGGMKANGDILLCFLDYQWIPADYLEKIDSVFESRMDLFVSGVAIEVSYFGKFERGMESVFSPPFEGWKAFTEPEVGRFLITTGIATKYPPFYIAGIDVLEREGKNIIEGGFDPLAAKFEEYEIPLELFMGAMPMKLFREINGFDERCDYNHTFMLRVLAWQVLQNGYKFMVDRNNWCYSINHRTWKMFNEQIGDNPNMWHIFFRDQDSKYNIKDINWTKRSPNNFNLTDGFT